MPGADTKLLTQVPFITGAGLLVVVAPWSRWQNGVYSWMQVTLQDTAWWHVGYVNTASPIGSDLIRSLPWRPWRTRKSVCLWVTRCQNQVSLVCE